MTNDRPSSDAPNPLPGGDYVLGTGDAEAERLGLQHHVWRDATRAAWRRAGLREGMRVLDAGAGPGHVTLDLAEAVGPRGEVIAVERSPRFAALLREACARRGYAHVTVIEADLMSPPALEGIDLAWCRWVACFVRSPERLVAWLSDAVKPGGAVVFHEYAAYEAWRYLPARPALERFVAEVMASWRAEGGEPNVAPALVGWLAEYGFRLDDLRPLVFASAPGEPFWRWPASFVEINLARLVELGRVDAAWAATVAAELQAAERSPESRMLTPLVAEIVAVRR